MLTQLVSALGRWWPCACLKCVFSLRRLEKTLKLLKCIHVFDLVLKYALDINEGNCLQLLFYFIVLMGVVASVIGICFFQQCFRFQNEVFSYCSLTETFANGFQMWFDHEWIDFGFFFRKWLPPLTSNLFGLKSTKIANFLLLLTSSIFSLFRLRGILVCSLKMLLLFSHRIS